jgi:hypothetical protein
MGLRWIARDWNTGAITGTLPFSKSSFTETLCAAGSWSGEMDPYDSAAALLVPHRTYVYALRDDGTIAFGGMLGALDWNASGGEGVDTLTASGYSLWGYFWRRLITLGSNFNNVEQFSIVQQLLDNHQALYPFPGYSIGVATAWNPAGGSGVPRVRQYFAADGKILGEAIEELCDCLNGFEFRVVPSWTTPPGTGARPQIQHTMELWYPRLGVDQPYIWRDGVAIRVTDYSQDDNAYASYCFATGAVSGNGSYANSAAGQVTVPGEPIYEVAINATDVTDTATLQDKADQAIQTSTQYLIQVELVDQDTWPYGSWAVGDTVRLVSDRGSLQLHGDIYWRITGTTVEVDDIGAITTSIDFTDALRRSKPVTRAARALARKRDAQASAISTLQRHP